MSEPKVSRPKGDYVQLSMATYQFFIGEAMRVHELMDEAGIPRTTADESRLSFAQRVELFMRREMRRAACDARENPSH